MGDNRFRVVGKIPIVTNILHGCHVVKALCVRSLKTVMPFSATHWTQHALEMARVERVLLPLKSGYLALALLY